jgi:hypothetical protein
MRMPIFSYFIVMGTVLVGLLFWVSNEIDPNSVPLKTSQVVGVPETIQGDAPRADARFNGCQFRGCDYHGICARHDIASCTCCSAI